MDSVSAGWNVRQRGVTLFGDMLGRCDLAAAARWLAVVPTGFRSPEHCGKTGPGLAFTGTGIEALALVGYAA